MGRSKGRPVRRFLLVVVQLALMISVMEASLRLLKPHHQGLRGLLYSSSTSTDYSSISDLRGLMETTIDGFTPNTARHGFILNSRSFRTREYTFEKPAASERIVALGDSFTYGVVPHEKNWTTRLELLLWERRGAGIEILNLGVPGTGTPFQLRLWQLEASSLDPDLVVLAFFVGNDFYDDLGMEPGWQGLEDRLVTSSHAYRVIRNLLRWRRASPSRSAGEVESSDGHSADQGDRALAVDFDESRATYSEESYEAIESQRMSICLHSKRARFDLRFDRIARLIERLHWEVEASQARLLVMIIPDEFQVDARVRTAAIRHAGLSADDYDLERPQRRLGEFLEKRDIDYLDLLPAFRRHLEETPLFIPRNSHWNSAGNQLAAELLVEYLEAR